jgi:hypothetical protein
MVLCAANADTPRPGGGGCSSTQTAHKCVPAVLSGTFTCPVSCPLCVLLPQHKPYLGAFQAFQAFLACHP